MADINLNTTNSKYIDYTIINRNFMNNMARMKRENQLIDLHQIGKITDVILNKLKGLSSIEMDQWVQIHQLKIKEIYRSYKDEDSGSGSSKSTKKQRYGNSLRQSLHILVRVTKQCNQYNSSMIADVIQAFYYQEYQEDIIQALKQAGYKTGKYQTLHYEKSSFFNLCCCWEPSSKAE